MKKKLWKKAAVALGFGFVVAGIGVGGNALYVNAEETDSNEPSTVQNTVLETPEMTKGYLHITSTVSDYDVNKTWDRWDGYILTMQLTQSDLSSFTSFWWNIEAKGGAYASSVKDYTECFIGFQSAQGRNFIWGSPDWGDNGTDIVHYSPTFLGTEFGQTAVNRRVQFAAKGNAWYTIPATKVAISKDENATSWENSEVAGEGNSYFNNVAYATVWMPSRTFDADIAIGALYGVKEDGSYSLLFDPSASEQVNDTSLLDSANKYCTEATVGDGAVHWSIAKIEATNLMPLHDGIGVNNYFDVPVANVLPEDISVYNGISYYIDNTQSTLPTDLQLKIREKDNGEQWYSDNQKATLFYENSETATGDYVVLEKGNEIPAGKKGTVVIPFSSFYRMWDPNINNKFDLNSIGANLTLVYHPQAETYANGYSVGNFTLVTDAKAKFKEYRLYQKADGSYPEITVNGNTVTYEDNDNIKAIDRVETDGASFDTLTKPESGITNENLYEFERATVPTKYTPVTDGGEVNVRIVPLTYYARKEYTISFTNGATEGETFQSITQKWGSPLTLPETARVGYDFVWKHGETEYTVPTEMPAENITLTAVWTAKTDTAYTVKHFKQLADGTYSLTPDETENKTGTTDTLTAETAKGYDHYTAQTITQQNIAGNGSAVVEIRYARNSYTVTFLNGSSVFATKNGLWGAEVELPEDPTGAITGMVFGGWYLGTENDGSIVYGDEYNRIIPTSDLSVFAKYGYPYTVKHLLQNLAGDGYDEQTADSESKVGDAGEATAAEAKAYTGFTAQTVTQGTITTDGNTVVNVYYTRNGYTVTFDVNGTKTQQVVKYGGKVDKPEDPSVEGYTFGGWKLNDNSFDFDAFTMGTSDITITATFERIPAESGLPSGAIAVIVLGSVLAVSAAASVGIVVFLKKRKK